MSVPKSFEMILNNETLRISYRRRERTDPWTVLVNGEAFALGERRKQNDWVVTAYGQKFRGRTLQPAVMDAVRYEYPRRK